MTITLCFDISSTPVFDLHNFGKSYLYESDYFSAQISDQLINPRSIFTFNNKNVAIKLRELNYCHKNKKPYLVYSYTTNNLIDKEQSLRIFKSLNFKAKKMINRYKENINYKSLIKSILLKKY